MSTDNDLVARLRIRWDAMGDMANAERAAAATEIERFRKERDSARRMYCSEVARNGSSPAAIADALGWDLADE